MDPTVQILQALHDLSAQMGAFKRDVHTRLNAIDNRLLALEATVSRAINRPSAAHAVPSPYQLAHAVGPGAVPYTYGQPVPPSLMIASPPSAGLDPPQSRHQPPSISPPNPGRSESKKGTQHGSSENARYLPFALEEVAFFSRGGNLPGRPAPQWYSPLSLLLAEGESNQTSFCGDNKGPSCFRARHFDWCATHSKDVPFDHQNCEGMPDCKVIHWGRCSLPS